MSKPLRILQVVTIMNRGGLETMLMNYYRNVDRSKIQFDFLVHRSERGAYDDEIESMGGKIYRFAPIKLANLPAYIKNLRKFFILHPEYKIAHSHLDSLSALPLAIAKIAKVPVRIAHSHTSNFDKNIKATIRSSVKKLIKYVATDFAGCSEDAIKFMFGNGTKKFTVINNAIDIQRFVFNVATRNKMRSQLGIPKSAFVIGHVGWFSYPKNHEFLVDVFQKVYEKNNSAVLLLVGRGDGQKFIEKKVKALGLNDNVMFLGARADVPDIMQAMDIFVMPSRYEGLPVVSIEAQATGLPCVFSDAVTENLNVTGNCAFLGLGESLDDWAEEILLHLSQSRSDTGKAIADGGYDVTVEAVKLQDLYVSHSMETRDVH